MQPMKTETKKKEAAEKNESQVPTRHAGLHRAISSTEFSGL
jgi:hypothetical protein